ncbi:hypothetical protein BKA70DRAFT_1194583 [Coprinopsis sp. MPI-PUGE-AT-0042]|nr:hypothetical protein BKA70DRAFT_1194583 [Coprinopsis sp. MPI-PUGE-AT-0042]
MPVHRQRRNAVVLTLDLPVSRQKREQLLLLAAHFGLETEDLTVADIRARINEYLDDNYQQYATDDRYKKLYGRRLNIQEPQQQVQQQQQQQQQDEQRQRSGAASSHRSSSSSSSSSQDDEESWHGIGARDLVTPQGPRQPTPPGSVRREAQNNLVHGWIANQRTGPPAAQGAAFQPIPNTNVIDTTMVAVPPITNTSAHHRNRPARVRGQVASGAGYHIPESIRRNFMGGWKNHVPLNQLTDAYCMYRHSSALPSHEDTIVLDPLTGQISSAAKPIAAEEEERLSFDEWYQAQRRLMDLIREFVPEEYDDWRAHFDRILNSETRAEHWQLWLLYDIEIRNRAHSSSIDPSLFHLPVWNDLELRYLARKAQASSQHHSTRRDSRDHRFRSNTFRPSYNQQPNNYKLVKCIFCGDNSGRHPLRNCTSTVNVAGKPCFLSQRNPDEPRRDAQGRQYCFHWNGTRGCGPTDCQYGIHACTLCGSRHHSAQRCTSL